MSARSDESRRSDRSTSVTRASERELVVTRVLDCPARMAFDAWTRPELFQRWWVPKSFGLTLLSCELDVRTGGGYRLVFAPVGGATEPMAFHGRYVEVTPPTRLVWTNEESAGVVVTTVTFEEKEGKTHLVMRDLHPSKESLDEAIASGSTSGLDETFQQLAGLLAER